MLHIHTIWEGIRKEVVEICPSVRDFGDWRLILFSLVTDYVVEGGPARWQRNKLDFQQGPSTNFYTLADSRATPGSTRAEFWGACHMKFRAVWEK